MNDCLATKMQREDKPNKQEIVYEKTYTYNDSPLKFRNFIAISFEEDSKQYYYQDNEFYLSSVKEFNGKHFDFTKLTSFFIKLELKDAVYTINHPPGIQ